MNLKLINKLFICLFILFLFSCESLDLLSQKKKIYEKVTEVKEIEEEIILNKIETKKNYEDFYTLVNLKKFNFKKKFTKVASFNTKRKKIQNSKNLISIIHENQFIFLDLQSNLNIYGMKELNLIKSIDLKTYINNDDSYPTSIAKIKNNFYISYSQGVILNIDLEGKLIWSKDLKKIIKTPIKIYNNNLIVLTGNDIILIDSFNGKIKWQFNYGSKEIFQATGGDIVNLNHLLFFILPNGKVGEINTIFREKNTSIFSKYNFELSINNSFDKLHSFNNILSYFDQRNFLYSFDMGKNKILLNDEKISNVHSFKFFNNSIFLLDKNNLLKSINIINRKLFWEIDLSSNLKLNDKIIHLSNLSDSLIVIFESGILIELNNRNGSIISSQKLKIDKISHVKSSDNYLIMHHHKNKITLLTQ